MKSTTLSSPEDKNAIRKAVSSSKIFTAAVARLHVARPDPSHWTYSRIWGAAVFCIDKSKNNSFFIRIVDLEREAGVIWEQELYDNFDYIQDAPFFHSFETDDCLTALEFVSEDEADTFYKKIQNRQSLSSKARGAETNENDLLRKDKRKNKIDKNHIGMPADFRHISHIGYTPGAGFSVKNNDPEMKGILDQLQALGISADEINENQEFIQEFLQQSNQQLPQQQRSPLAPSPSVNQRKKAPPPPPPGKHQGTPPPPPPPRRSNNVNSNGHRNSPPPPPPTFSRASIPAPPTPSRGRPAPPPPPPSRNNNYSAPTPPPVRPPTSNYIPTPPQLPHSSSVPVTPGRPSIPSSLPRIPPPMVNSIPTPPSMSGGIPPPPPPPPPTSGGIPAPPPPPPPQPPMVNSVPAPPPPPPMANSVPAPPPPPMGRPMGAPTAPPAPPMSSAPASMSPSSDGRNNLMASIRSAGGFGTLKSSGRLKASSTSDRSAPTNNSTSSSATGAATGAAIGAAGGAAGGDLASSLANVLKQRKQAMQSDDEADDEDEWE